MKTDAVHQNEDNKWYYWTLDFSEAGPFDTFEEANDALKKYLSRFS